jgi:hypothetical protein
VDAQLGMLIESLVQRKQTLLVGLENIEQSLTIFVDTIR